MLIDIVVHIEAKDEPRTEKRSILEGHHNMLFPICWCSKYRPISWVQSLLTGRPWWKMDVKETEEGSSPVDPALERSSTADLMLHYALEEATPIASTVTSTVETEDVPTPIDETLDIEPDAESSEPAKAEGKAETSDDDESILLRPPPTRKIFGQNYAFYSGTYNLPFLR